MKKAYWTLCLFALGTFAATAVAQNIEKGKKLPHRFGYDLDQITFPQQTPKDAMNSVVRAVERRKVDYLLAHVADPAYVDYWIDRYMGDFVQGGRQAKTLLAYDRLIRETQQYYDDDPKILRDLRIFAKEGEWSEADDVATGTAKSVASRKVYLRRVGDRWFLENRQQPKPAQK